MRNLLNRLSAPPTRVGVLLLFALVGLVVLSARAWYQELSAPVTCTLQFPNPKPQNGYIEFQVLSQLATETLFDGQIFVVLMPGEYTLPAPSALEYRRSAEKTYADHVGTLRLAETGAPGNLRMPSAASFGYVNHGQPHRWFPFDNGMFDFHFTLEPVVTPGYVRIVNRVPGFVMECPPAQAHRNADGSLDVRFNLVRSPLVRLVAVLLCFAMVIFGVTMFGLKRYDSLATAVASYFFSLWSIRHIVSSEVHVFPTLLDMFILSVSTLVLLGLVWRVLRHEESNNSRPK